ncbi:transmembrane protein 47-like [Ruditapes philippinarum]|uniref:transmembrane protein 47-like n=1 Tax=Ruditapes philippinarum TaxID=129788 RepID=UPI00295AF2EA|nr:transmembrane protein 47-like [Ruditapes philippinarum]
MGEKIIVITPAKIVAEVLCVITVVWLLVAVAGEGWVVVRFLYFEDQTWTWGLWKTCNRLEDVLIICVNEDWITVCLVFSIIALILSMAASVCGLLGMRDPDNKPNIFYKVAAGFLSVVALLEFMVVVIFPVKFGQDIRYAEAVRRWDFDWAYGFAWGGLIFSIGAAISFVMPMKCLSIKSDNRNEEYSKGSSVPEP